MLKLQIMSERQRFRKLKKFAKNTLLTAAIVGGVSMGDYAIRHSIADTKQAQMEQQVAQNDDVLFPGYFEAKYHIESEFFGTEGHIPWLIEAMEIPELNSIGREVVDELYTQPDHFNGPGDVLLATLKATHRQLHEQFPQSIPDTLEGGLEDPASRDILLRYALITHAGILNPYEKDFTTKFGLEETRYKNHPWGLPNGFMNLYRNTGMLYSPPEWGGIEYAGIDREVHTAHYALTSYLLGQSYDYGQNLHYETLPLLGAGPAWLRLNEPYMNFAGFSYEVLMSRKFSNSDGFFDKSVWHDFVANRIGREMGELLTDATLEEVFALVDALNGAGLKVVTRNPEIPRDLNEVLRRRYAHLRMLPASPTATAASTTRRAAA